MGSTKFEFISSQTGLNPTPSEAQKQALNKLNQQLQVKLKTSKSKKDVREALEPEVQFDLMSRTRVIIWRSNVLKKRKAYNCTFVVSL